MVKPLWTFCFGLFSWISISQSQIIISCRFQGVFHVEKAARYSLVFEEAKKTCSELDAMIATKEQVETAHAIGFETCRYGWVENGTVVIPRTTGNPICAAGFIGVYVLHSNVTIPYDVYCYNVSETSEKNCEQYDYHNKSLPSYDPTEEGDIHHSPSSEVSPTHPGQDISPSLTEQGGLVEDRTIDPLMSTTEFPEHSGDHLGTKEDEGGIKSPNLGPNEIDHTNEYDGFIEVKTDDEVLASAEDNRPATDPTIQRETGSFNDEIPLVPDERGKIEMTPEPDSTKNYTESSSGGEAEGSSDSSKNKHRRRAAVPEWLIVCVALVCLGLIFSVCIAINARRLCGQKKKLVINGNKASPEDGVIMEQNGDTVKSQEMVQLVSRDQTSDFGDGDGFSQDNMRNAKDVDMKIGV